MESEFDKEIRKLEEALADKQKEKLCYNKELHNVSSIIEALVIKF